MPRFSKRDFIISKSLLSLVSVTKERSGEFGSSSISFAFLNAAMAHSIMGSSGSRVVSFCSRYPGALRGSTRTLSVLERRRSTS